MQSDNSRLDQLINNRNDILKLIREASISANRDFENIDLVTVTKYADTNDVALLLENNLITNAGENKVQDARAKWHTGGPLNSFRKNIQLHLIGHLQHNKVKTAVEVFDWIDSIDSLRTAEAVDRHAAEAGKTVPCLIQLKLTDRDTQSGIRIEEAPELLRNMRQMNNIAACGYMGIAPEGASSEELTKLFKNVRAVFDRDFKGSRHQKGFRYYLSLGMSGDFKEAVACGATLPRIGSLSFK